MNCLNPKKENLNQPQSNHHKFEGIDKANTDDYRMNIPPFMESTMSVIDRQKTHKRYGSSLLEMYYPKEETQLNSSVNKAKQSITDINTEVVRRSVFNKMLNEIRTQEPMSKEVYYCVGTSSTKNNKENKSKRVDSISSRNSYHKISKKNLAIKYNLSNEPVHIVRNLSAHHLSYRTTKESINHSKKSSNPINLKNAKKNKAINERNIIQELLNNRKEKLHIANNREIKNIGGSEKIDLIIKDLIKQTDLEIPKNLDLGNIKTENSINCFMFNTITAQS